MAHKKESKTKSFLILIAVLAVTAAILYLFSKVFFPLGIVFIIAGAVVGVMGVQNKSGETFVVGVLVFVLGLILAILGLTGLSLFGLGGVLC